MLSQDIRYALRSLSRAPGFSVVALLTLALGIGGTTAIFSIVDGVLLRPLPYSDSGRILRVARLAAAVRGTTFSAGDYRDLKKSATLLTAIAGFRADVVDMTGRGEPRRVTGLQTTAAFFDVFDAPPLLGRMYHEATDRPGTPVAVISESLWRQQFGADPNIAGVRIRLNGIPTEIIGVAPAFVRHPLKSDAWMLSPLDVPTSPFGGDADKTGSRDVNYFDVVARVSPARQVSDAVGELTAIGDRMARENPATNAEETLTGEVLASSMITNVRTAMFVLLGAMGFVLLIACANVAGLLIARGASRRREMAVRSALGAGRGRLVQQLLTESLVLAVGGGALGLLLSGWLVEALVALAPEDLPRLSEVGMDWRVAAFGCAATLIVGVLFGLTPAWQTSRPDLSTGLKDGGRGGTTRSGLRSVMVVSQVALALVLSIAAGLMLTSFSRLRAVDPGFRVTEVVTVELLLPLARYNEADQRRFYAGVLDRLQANPITAQSAMLFPFPFGGGNAQAQFTVVGQPAKPRGQQLAADLNSISPGYLKTAGLQLIKGRDFTSADDEAAAPVALISESAVKEFNGRDPIGEQIDLGDPVTVVGIVSDARRSSLAASPNAAVYLPFKQFVLPYMGAMVRTDRGAAAVARAVKAAVAELDPDLPMGDVRTMEQIIERSTGEPRFRSSLIACFAGLALVLAAVGVYGLISFTVTQRIPEIGVRLALGASPTQVFSHVIGDGLRLAVIGIVLGVVAAIGATTAIRGLLFNTEAVDPLIYGGLSLLLLTMAALACYVPARRAMRVDPLTALHSE